MKHAIVLTNPDHVGTQHNISINVGNLDVSDDDSAQVALPDGTDLDAVRLRCVNCDCVLMRGEDFEFEEVAAESWR